MKAMINRNKMPINYSHSNSHGMRTPTHTVSIRDDTISQDFTTLISNFRKIKGIQGHVSSNKMF